MAVYGCPYCSTRNDENKALAARLAEAEALLLELWACECYGWPDDLPDRIDAFLGAKP